MKFKDYMTSLPNQRNEMISELTKLCRVSESTVYRWMRGDFNPDPLKGTIISDYPNLPERDRWPAV